MLHLSLASHHPYISLFLLLIRSAAFDTGTMSNPNLAEVMGDGPASISDKLTLLPGYEPDFSAVTFCLKEEDHTLGNSLRYIIMKE